MSYIHYDPTSSAVFENFVSNQQQKRNRIINWVIIGGLACITLIIVIRRTARKDDEDIGVS